MLIYHEYKWMMFRWLLLSFLRPGTRLPSKYEVTGKYIVYSVAIPTWPILRI